MEAELIKIISWSDERVMKESLLNRSWINEKYRRNKSWMNE